MRPMTKEEIVDLIQDHRWTTLCTVTPDGEPYAIEFSYFLMDGCVCGMIHPDGKTSENLKHQPRVCLKMC